ncbi:hypothetical protein KDK88_05495 [bacterium]|nr:hypothetical protein [bacterium]HPF35667.1 hypothetical protein [Candidatus Krumholzibacteria bacterium]HRX51351.1 hypothetical protein [Candidatus Krumholzibacteria bacterium]
MHRSLLRREILPFLFSFLALILFTILIDAALHRAGLVAVGRWLGIPGTVLILASFGYSARKRKLIRRGGAKAWLRSHEVLAWTGVLLVLVHAGVHVHAPLPWLALGAMLINVLSGLTGTWLLQRSRRRLEARREDYRAQGLSEAEAESRLAWDAVSYSLMRKWRTVHLPITVVCGGLALIHVASVLLLWGWR